MSTVAATTPQLALPPGEVVDDNGRAIIPPDMLSTPPNGDIVIAPWLEQADDTTPPPKHAKNFGFSSKPSFSSLASLRQASVTSLISRPSRPSESSSIASSSTYVDSIYQPPPRSSPELRKSKSSIFSRLRSRSKTRFRSGSTEETPPVPEFMYPVPIPPSPTYSIQSQPATPKRDKDKEKDKEKKSKKKMGNRPSPLPSKETEFTLDTNIQDMDGIIDLTMINNVSNNDPSSPSSGFDSYQDSYAPSIISQSHSEYSYTTAGSSAPPPQFSNPFSTSATPLPSVPTVSPTSIPPTGSIGSRDGTGEGRKSDAKWIAPESWEIENGVDPADQAYSTEEDSAGGEKRLFNTAGATVNGNNATGTTATQRRKSRNRKTQIMRPPRPFAADKVVYKLRIHRASGQYHIVSIGLPVSVAALTPALNDKLLFEADKELHRLYLKERGRERILGQKERPADIFRRRMEQAGYEPTDGMDILGSDDMSFLLKFVYKSQLLGPTEEELTFDNYELVDLTGRGLRTVPIVLHQHADEIVSLKLSRNPMLEIPLDFIQSCTSLRELRLSNMAMKKVPHSVRQSVTLRRLDLSCNRIVDLDEAGLDRIPELRTILAQNNRMEKLPWYFPRLRHLTTLNISNNKFQRLPAVVSEMISLDDLDISFNMISELPDEIGQLKNLGRFIIVGNQVTKLPETFSQLCSLQTFDCRRNQISDLSNVCSLPRLEKLSADHNAVHALELSLGPRLITLDASHNEITQISLISGPVAPDHYTLTSLDISHAKLSSIDDAVLSQLSSLQVLKLDYNSFRSLPETLGDLSNLEILSCCDNQLDTLPSSIGRLQRLEYLDAHNNSLKELPISLWNCASLTKINMTSNLLDTWHDPPPVSWTGISMTPSLSGDGLSVRSVPGVTERKTSTTGSIGSGRPRPPLAMSLERLYLGENRLTDDVLHPLTLFRELRVLNLSFNEIQDMPSTFFKDLTRLEELYLSGNKLTSIPTEDLPKLTRLAVLFLNGNRLQTLPQELGKVQSLMVLDVGSNLLKYNINNWEFDWNWNFNKNLRYLNLSGNKKLQIKSDIKERSGRDRHGLDKSFMSRQSLSGFTSLTQLRVLGLMDVTITTTGINSSVDIPDESEDRRVRTSSSTVNGMAYGIADNIGRHDNLNVLDLVHEFRGSAVRQSIFAMFSHAQQPKPGGSGSNRLAKYLRDNFLGVFTSQLTALNQHRNETVPDALRRTFLTLNKDLHDTLYSVACDRKNSQSSSSHVSNIIIDAAAIRSGASGVVLYFVGKTMYVANVGNALAVVSRHGTAELVSRKHDPFDRKETVRIRGAEGWVSPPGLVNDEVDTSRSFGFYHLLPIVNAKPDIFVRELTELDEFVIVGNRGLWDYVSYQTAVDIAREERGDPMIAAQKLRDFAISYGAEGSMMIMVIGVADILESNRSRSRQLTAESLIDAQTYNALVKRRRKDEIANRNISRLDDEVPPPVGHLALVFTDIRNSTHLWEVNPGMPTAMRLHNNLLRRQLRLCGGYEVKTEGDAFMCSFPTSLAALWWALTVQVQLLHEQWPLEILECEDGKEVHDTDNRLIARGLSVRMGIHAGSPLCEPDPITHRMDYFGPMVNRTARISGNAKGGQIMCSIDIIREINAKILETESETDYSDLQPIQAIESIRQLGVVVIPVGEVRLKGLENSEFLSLVYPVGLETRQDSEDAAPNPDVSASRVQFSAAQIRELGLLCLRLEACASGRIFRLLPERKASIQTVTAEDEGNDDASTSPYFYGDPNLLLPRISDKASDNELMMILDSLSCRIENASAQISRHLSPEKQVLTTALLRAGLDERTLQRVMSIL